MDNILLKLLKYEECASRMMRIAPSDVSVNPTLSPYILRKGNRTNTSFPGLYYSNVKDLDLLLRDKSIVASTCLGVRQFLFSGNLIEFDLCIVDEASQLTEPVCLGPLRFANMFLLVGDHYQLPPVFVFLYFFNIF